MADLRLTTVVAFFLRRDMLQSGSIKFLKTRLQLRRRTPVQQILQDGDLRGSWVQSQQPHIVLCQCESRARSKGTDCMGTPRDVTLALQILNILSSAPGRSPGVSGRTSRSLSLWWKSSYTLPHCLREVAGGAVLIGLLRPKVIESVHDPLTHLELATRDAQRLVERRPSS